MAAASGKPSVIARSSIRSVSLPFRNWYETLGLAEALAIIIVFVVVGAGVIALAQGRRR
jgi:hypothetical protein